MILVALLTGLALGGSGLPAGDVARGEQLDGLAGCSACHTAEQGPALAGGFRLETPYGDFVSPNITPDPDHGIGAWSDDDFLAAMRRGRAPRQHLYPAFPYAAYTGMSDQDIADLWAWLQAADPVAQDNQPHALTRYRWRGALAFWKLLELRRGPLSIDPADPLDRGRYLVEAVTHCGECHTPRNGMGGLKRRLAMAGTDAPPEPAPDIRPEALGWSVRDWEDFLDLGMTPDGDFVGGEMARVIEAGTARLSVQDRRAVARWMVEGVD